MKSRSKGKRRKSEKNQNLGSDPDSLLDEQQIATENLFDVSDFHDHINYEKDFNGIFQMFRSVDLDEKSSNPIQNDQKSLHLKKFSSTTKNDAKFWPKNLENSKNKFQESKFLIKIYESNTEQDSSRSPTLRIRKKKILEKNWNFNQKASTFKAFKSDSVFVGKNQHHESIIEVDEKRQKLKKYFLLKNNQNSLIFKKSQKLPSPKKISDLAICSPKIKTQKFKQDTLKNIKTLSPENKPHSILLQYSQFKRLESLYTVRPLSKATLGPCSELKKKTEQKLPRSSMQKPDTKKIGRSFLQNPGNELSPSRYNETKRKKVFF